MYIGWLAEEGRPTCLHYWAIKQASLDGFTSHSHSLKKTGREGRRSCLGETLQTFHFGNCARK